MDRQDLLKTLAEVCQKTGWQVDAYCLMRNHYHLVLETPNGNLVAGMAWLQSPYTIRLNHRHKLFGHVFSGRYKAQMIEGSGNGYLRTGCDYVHLNPVRARPLKPEDRLLAYPWSSLAYYLASPEHRPRWIGVDRLLGEHGIQQDTPAGRQEFERRMEARRLETQDEEGPKAFPFPERMGGSMRASSWLERARRGCVKRRPQAYGGFPGSRNTGWTGSPRPPRSAPCPGVVRNRGRLEWAARLFWIGWFTFCANPEARSQTNTGTPMSIHTLPGGGHWIAGSSSLQAVSPLANIRLAGLAGDAVLEFRGGYGASAPTSLWVQTNSAVAAAEVYRFPPSLSEEVFLPTAFGHFVLMFTTTNRAMPREIWKGDLTLTNWSRVFAWPAASNVPPSTTILRQGWSADPNGNVYAGEYNSDDAAYPDYRVHLYKGTGNGESWSAVYAFPPRNLPGPEGGVRHVHACEVDPYTGHVWIATGDTDSQARIYYHTNALLPDADGVVRLTLVGSGSQEYRAVSLAFTGNYIYWFMDAPSYPQKIFRIHRAGSYPVLSPQTPSAQDYRECIGVFPDKPFYYSRLVRSGARDVILVVSHYDDAAQYGTSFRELDKWNRVFGIKESADSTVQVQEVFAVLATAKYAYFDPLGQNSRGEIFFRSGDVAGVDTATGYKGVLDWHDVPAYAPTNYTALLLSWTSQTNGHYQVRGCQDLRSNGWYNVGLGFHGDGLTNSLYYSADRRGARFFQLQP